VPVLTDAIISRSLASELDQVKLLELSLRQLSQESPPKCPPWRQRSPYSFVGVEAIDESLSITLVQEKIVVACENVEEKRERCKVEEVLFFPYLCSALFTLPSQPEFHFKLFLIRMSQRRSSYS
jgi:hypothetical protein